MAEPTIFKRIIDGEIPAEVVYQDEKCMVFKDINPQAPTHLLIIPKKEIPKLADVEAADAELLGHLLFVAKKVADDLGLESYRVVNNCGADAGQDVFHLHLHLLAGRKFTWPPG